MKQNVYLFVALFVIMPLLTTGCVTNPINAYTGGKYYDYGLQAENEGNWELARQDFSRAYVNAQLGNFGPVTEAYCVYEWSRVTG